MKVAVAQMTSASGIDQNMQVVRDLCAQARKAHADVIVLPENFASMAIKKDQYATMAEKLGMGRIQDDLSQLAQSLRIWIIAGSIPTQSDDVSKPYSTCTVWNDQGQLVAHYHKMHLFDVDLPEHAETYRESSYHQAGSEPKVVHTPWHVIGLSICYDLRFPELYRQEVTQGATVLVVPAAFTQQTGKQHFIPLLKARAIENQCYVLAANQVGRHENGRQTYGHSVIIDPQGHIMDEVPLGQGLAMAELELEPLQNLRKHFPVLKSRRI